MKKLMENIFYIIVGLVNVAVFPIRFIVYILKIILGHFEAIKIEEKFPEYLYHVVPTEDIKSIEESQYIGVSKHNSDIFTGLDNNKFIFYCYGEKPKKSQYIKSKGNIYRPMSLIIIKYDKINMKDLYTRKHDKCLMLLMNDNKLSLENKEYKVENLNW